MVAGVVAALAAAAAAVIPAADAERAVTAAVTAIPAAARRPCSRSRPVLPVPSRPIPELARLARAHNDANILVMPARFIEPTLALAIVDEFLATPFDGGRHEKRIAKIPCQ